MGKKIARKLPFYDDKKYMAIYDDRIIIPGPNGRVIYFSDIHYIIFRKIGFTLYTRYSRRPFVTVILKYMGMVDLQVPIQGYYSLKQYYEKGKKDDGSRQFIMMSVASIAALISFLIYIYVSILSV